MEKTTPENWDDLHSVCSSLLMPGISGERLTDLYNQWAKKGYDEALTKGSNYGALTVLENAMKQLFPRNRDKVVILDIGAGTGISGKHLLDAGFRIIDALDPASEMLDEAKKKNIYRNFYNCFMTGDPLDIPADTYDAVVMVGVVGHGSLPYESFEEMTRIVKPGGYIVNCMREVYLREIPEYAQNWEPLVARMQREGKWKTVKMDKYPNHFMDNEGLLMIIRVLN